MSSDPQMRVAVTDEQIGSVVEVIHNYKVVDVYEGKIKEAKDSEYGKLYNFAQQLEKSTDCSNRGMHLARFDYATTSAETKWMVDNVDPKVGRTKSGKWKFRTYLPKGYSSAKSVLRNAIDLGVLPSDEKIGKTALERRVKEAKKETSSGRGKTEKTLNTLDWVRNVKDALYDELINLNALENLTPNDLKDPSIEKEIVNIQDALVDRAEYVQGIIDRGATPAEDPNDAD